MMARLTSPDKVLWPDVPATKADLATYLAAASSRLLPHLQDRPLSVRCFPRGIDSPGFFLKDLPDHAPDTIRRWTMWASSAERDVHYALVDDADDLAWFAQQNTIEFHPAVARADQAVDLLVFDLDPGERELPVARAARWVVEALVELDLVPIAKTSGGRGVHVIVPLADTLEPGRVRPLTLAISRMVADRHPDDLTVQMRKQDRGGRTLVDWSRSSPGATLIAPWSPRAHPNATVATPLALEELDDDLDPTDFTIDTVLERHDPWPSDVTALAQDLRSTCERVVAAGYELVDSSPRGHTDLA